MRKTITLLLCLSLCGCSISLPDIPPYTTAQADHSHWQPMNFADIAECGFWVERCDINSEGDYLCHLVCHNRSDAPQVFSCEAWCIDNWQVLPFWGKEVAPGAKETFSVALSAPKMEENAIIQSANVSFDLRIFSQADLRQNYLVNAHCVFNPSGEELSPIPPEPLSWNENDMVLANNSGCTMVLTGARQMPGHYQVDCLLENKTRSNMMFRLSDPAFNGVETEQVWTLQLTAGTKCAQTIVFELPQTAGHMRWLELDVQVFNIDEWFGRVWADEEFCIRVTDF